MSRVLVISPHPDDESVGCGGTLRMHALQGDDVHVIFLTSGEKGGHGRTPEETVRVRAQEARAAAGILGIVDVEFWHQPDGGLRADRHLMKRLHRKIKNWKPELLYVPHEAEMHSDHRASLRLVRLTLSSLPSADRPVVRMYEVWTPMQRMDLIVDISPYIDAKISAIRAHKSQCQVMRFDEAVPGLNRYRGEMHSGWPAARYAEIFRVPPWSRQKTRRDHSAACRAREDRDTEDREECEELSASGPVPSVSVIVCTHDRPELLDRALRSIAHQDVQDFEVIVVDDGSEPPVKLKPADRDWFRLIRTEHRGTGSARSAALKLARSPFVAYCDDDDEWKPNHLSVLLKFLLDHPEVDLAYADSNWEQKGSPQAVAYSIDYDLSELLQKNYIFATDVMHRTHAAREAGGFDPSLRTSEDWDLWLRMSQRYVLRHVRAVLSVRHWHNGCIGSSERSWYEEEAVRLKHTRRLVEEGLAPSHQARRGKSIPPFDPKTWQQGRRELIWHSIMAPTHSYGYVARRLLLALEGCGVDIAMAPIGNQPINGFERFYKPVDHDGRLAFYYHYSPEASRLPFERRIVYSMWESRSVPKEHVDDINRAASLLYVPCRQNMEDFAASGVHIPTKVLHHAVDSNDFPYLARPQREIFTFGTFGNLSIPRKGTDVLIRAFQDEFCPTDSVRLLLKSTRPPDFQLRDPRIRVISDFIDHSLLLELLGEMDAFILPSRGEGFGLCGLEAMSTGLPLVATNWSGPQEYLDPTDSFPLSYQLEAVRRTAASDEGHSGLWAEPDYEHLRYLMRWLYEHPREAKAKGRMASDRVHRDWTWDRIANQICNDLDAVAAAR